MKRWEELNDFYARTVELYDRQLGVLRLIVLVMALLSVTKTVNMTVHGGWGEVGNSSAVVILADCLPLPGAGAPRHASISSPRCGRKSESRLLDRSCQCGKRGLAKTDRLERGCLTPAWAARRCEHARIRTRTEPHRKPDHGCCSGRSSRRRDR